MKRIIITLIGIGCFFCVANSQSQDFEQILQLIDTRSNFQGDLATTVSLEIKDPDEGDDSRTAQMFRRDAEDTFLILIQKPAVELGQGYLLIDNSLWFYDPESRRFTHTSMSESFENSGARHSDFGSSTLAEDYDVLSTTEAKLGNFDVWVLELEAVHSEVTYPFRTIYVTKNNNLLLKSDDYSLTKRLLRTSYYPSYAKAGDSYIAEKMIFVDALVENKSTSITLSNISTAKIPDSVFTKAYVERVNR